MEIISKLKFNLNFRKIKGFFNTHRTSILIISLVVLIALGIVCYENFRKVKPIVPVNKATETTVTTIDPRLPAPLTGILVDPEKANRRAIAVVIENHPDARPQSGYLQADIVYETLAEGGITRTLAIFSSQDCSEIGPVRSARPYFLDWASEWNAVFTHVGGNIEALDRIASEKISDLNQFYWSGYFWRSSDRYAPHNVYTTTEKLYAAISEAGYSTTGISGGYKFKSDLIETERPASQSISINFSSTLFEVGYEYSPTLNSYARSVGGTAHKDKATGAQLTTKNIVVLYQSVSHGTTRLGEQKVDIGTVGSGNAIVFLDGKAILAKWSKTSSSAVTKIVDENGAEIELNSGQTWFEVVPVGAAVTY